MSLRSATAPVVSGGGGALMEVSSVSCYMPSRLCGEQPLQRGTPQGARVPLEPLHRALRSVAAPSSLHLLCDYPASLQSIAEGV